MTLREQTSVVRPPGAGAVAIGRVLTRSPVAFAVVSLPGLVIDANSAFAEMTGVERDDVNGRRLVSFVAEPERNRFAAELDRLIAGELTDLHTEVQIARPDGSFGAAVVSGTAVRDEDAECVVVLIQDVTSHRSAERTSTALRGRLELLARAADLVHVELAVQPRMEALARMVVPVFCDLCAVYLLGPDGNLWLRSKAETQPHAGSQPEPFHDVPIARTSDTPVAKSARTGQIVRIEHFDADTPWPHDEARRDALRSRGASSLLSAPLMDQNETLGAVLFALHEDSRRTFDADDERFAADLVSRVSGALANAIQFEDEHFVAERLQRALLPERVPDVQGAEVVVRYRPSSGRGIGGDWYDVIRLADGRVAFAVGDVIGHGIDAAVAMSMIRHALLAYAIDESDPVELVTKLNRYLCRQPGRTTATLALVVCDLHSGDLSITTAGHLPVLVRDDSGAVEFHGARLGRPLGLSTNARFKSERTRLPLDGVLVMYTDGLVERRTESITDGLERLATGVGRARPDDGLDHFADTVEAQVASMNGPDDDVALLVLRRSVAADHFEAVVEARADRLGPVRTDLRRWLSYIGCSDPEAADLVLAISECAANVVEHAYPPGVTGELEIIAGVAPETSGRSVIKIDIRDHGRWRTPRDVGGGRGHELLRHLVDEARFDTGDDGTAVALRRTVALAATTPL